MKGEKFLEKGSKIENQRLFEAKTDKGKTNNERRKDEQ